MDRSRERLTLPVRPKHPPAPPDAARVPYRHVSPDASQRPATHRNPGHHQDHTMTAVFIFVPAFGSQVTATTFLATHALMPALGSRGIGCSIATLSHPDIADL